jgi:hypothetical protein
MMKQYRFPLLAVFIAIFAIPALRAQSGCYVRLTDASGYTPAAEQIAALEQAAAALCLAFDSSGFGGQFKVYDFGFYLHHETTAGGYPEPFARKVEAVAALSPYYLVFGKQSDRSGVYTRFWVEARLPDSLSFSCLDTIGAGILRTSFDLTANIEYEALGKMPSNYHLAEIRVMNKLKAEVDKLRECCYNQQRGLSSCDAPCLTPDETKKLLEQLGFTAIPIKILGPAQARGADGQRPVYNRVTDCAELDIEMDGVEYHDFAGTINNIMSVYQDSTVRAEILDEGCFCKEGVLYLKNIMEQKAIVLIICFFGEEMYTSHRFPDFMGLLPFKGHLPKKLTSSEESVDPLNMTQIKNIVMDIYKKNGFSLISFDFEEPSVLDTFDLYNEIINNIALSNMGYSTIDGEHLFSDRGNYINYAKTTRHFFPKTDSQKNYIVGVAVAHEFFHQILDKSVYYLDRFCVIPNLKDIEKGHCSNDRNLMFPGDGLSEKKGEELGIVWSNKEKMQFALKKQSSYDLYFSGVFFPESNNVGTNPWERIPSTFKYMVSCAMMLYELQRQKGELSLEIKYARLLIRSHLSNIKYNSYDHTK